MSFMRFLRWKPIETNILIDLLLWSGLGVSVDVFTLVCISIERYLAICHPFLLLKLQAMEYSGMCSTIILCGIWLGGFFTALPNLYMHQLCFLPTLKRYKCEKLALKSFDERIYVVILDGNEDEIEIFENWNACTKNNPCYLLVLYFLIPLAMMIVLYTLIILKMSEKNIDSMMMMPSESTFSLYFCFVSNSSSLCFRQFQKWQWSSAFLITKYSLESGQPSNQSEY